MNIHAFSLAAFGLLTLIPAVLSPGCKTGREYPAVTESVHYRVMFYNVENFFDTRDDSLTTDGDFTPQGALHWNTSRYHAKLENLYKTVIALGGWQPPDIIGICEVENRYVLSDLVNHTPLSKYPYRIVHDDSPDRRGIDVALVYNSKSVSLLQSTYFNINRPGLITREILYFKAQIHRDTCHFLVNHWPSRSAGQLRTDPDRLSAAKRLRSVVDSLFRITKNAKIVIVGDFNDEPQDESLSAGLHAGQDLRDPRHSFLYNLSIAPETGKFRGTVKYRGLWSIFDQVIVSGSLLLKNGGLRVQPDGYKIFGPSFLLMNDEQFNGTRPFRTYNGYKYLGGFSDHLPVYVDLFVGN